MKDRAEQYFDEGVNYSNARPYTEAVASSDKALSSAPNDANEFF